MTYTYTVTFIGDYTNLSTTVDSDHDLDNPDGITEDAVAFIRHTTGVDVYAARMATVDIEIDPA